MIRVYRICARRHARTAYSGEGARLYSGRWNPVGVPLVYTSASISLVVLELLVNVLAPEDLPNDFVAVSADIPPEVSILEISETSLPKGWNSPAPSSVTQAEGQKWISQARAVMSVPSVVVPTESNYLLNPKHPDFAKIRVTKEQAFSLDPRLLQRRTKE